MARTKARNAFRSWRSQLPPADERRIPEQKLSILNPPARLSFEDNYEETLAFILAIRARSSDKKERLGRYGYKSSFSRINLDQIKDIDPAVGLVLAGEMDRSFTKRQGVTLRSNDDQWHENVRELFLTSGLFELLRIAPKGSFIRPPAGPVRRMLKYRRGSAPDGQQADQLRVELEELCGLEFGPRVPVNNALCEAMTNVHHHAYPPGRIWYPMQPKGDWWATGAWSPDSGTMHMMIYDQGVGIPATLPRSSHWTSAIPLLDRLDPEKTDAGLIEAALELRRTSTDIGGRGRGLYEMAEWIDKTQKGFLRIMSGAGVVTFRPGNKVVRRTLSAPFCGTLVEWEVQHGA
ncbi:MAG: hypothetical protein EON95_16335 [Caulobacteraceae bacterium]|nr:MAG: hypothetical protein EON95_16335 [Caulobacteraceae bacterium]